MANNSELCQNVAIALNYYKTVKQKSIKDIADALELPASTVSSWNTGRHLPDMERLQRLANYLNAPIEQFFHFSLDKNADSELLDLHNQIDTDKDLLQFIKMFTKLSDEDKRLITLLAHKISK